MLRVVSTSSSVFALEKVVLSVQPRESACIHSPTVCPLPPSSRPSPLPGDFLSMSFFIYLPFSIGTRHPQTNPEKGRFSFGSSASLMKLRPALGGFESSLAARLMAHVRRLATLLKFGSNIALLLSGFIRNICMREGHSLVELKLQRF